MYNSNIKFTMEEINTKVCRKCDECGYQILNYVNLQVYPKPTYK